ncbi:acyl-CoA dehydrogenase family member 11 isoform X2 [Oncorhynchus keta]|uniref:acyl-CoA dehydrogenase family member 11 isoform X2 n=1 Tax=Oncorhynchus keta TaxID=8018 RepID=UPI00227A745B|nr:acyl-CoA dehydrogenase family member 11 isoform X2 [Oncorhynchus keta]
MEDQTATPVREQHRFNTVNLQRYLAGKTRGVSNNDRFTVRQYSAGQSNPTFLIQTPSDSYVLRKKPPGMLLPGAHKVDREYRVQKALFSAGFPVPQPLLHCTDAEVIGTEFYLMEHVQGRIFQDLRLPGVSAAERAALYVSAVEVLARLHSLDLTTMDLEGYGRGPGYCKRQVSTWTKQYRAAAHKEIPVMDKLSDWLLSNLPTNDNEVALVHGDFRVDNLIFHPTEARVVAVLDWELSTTGQPMADLAYFLMPNYLPSGLSLLSCMGSLRGVEGIPSPEDLISIYCRCREIPSSLHQLNFYLALSVFKMAGIAQGIYARHLLGNASAPNAAQFGQSVEPLAQVGLQIAENPSRSGPADARLFLQTAKGQAVHQQVTEFMKQHVLPAQQEVSEYYSKHAHSPQRWHPPQVIEDLKVKAREAGLWNLFLPAVSGLSQLDYAHIAEETGRCLYAPDLFNCQAPDTGNMEVLHMFGTEEQKREWLQPLLSGQIRSCFCMTEPDVASSDATNMECNLQRDQDHYVVHGRKWWSSGEGRGFEIAQGRLGPGRLHHCMRAVGSAEWALELLCQRAAHRQTFGKKLYQHEVVAHWIAECRLAIDQTRLLTLHAAHALDTLGSRSARKQIAMIKVVAGRMVCKVVDTAIQVYGGAGVSGDFPLAQMYAYARTLRIADGPDEVHMSSIAHLELRDQMRKAQAKL